MANWCDNVLIVESKSKESIEQFKSAVKAEGTVLSFGKLMPTPLALTRVSSPPDIIPEKGYKSAIAVQVIANPNETIPITRRISKNLKKKFGTDNWYDWHMKNWGVRCDVDAELCEELLVRQPYQLIYSFLSAWSPPAQWLHNIAPRFPKLSFRLEYCETGNDFGGTFKVKGRRAKDTDTSARVYLKHLKKKDPHIFDGYFSGLLEENE